MYLKVLKAHRRFIVSLVVFTFSCSIASFAQRGTNGSLTPAQRHDIGIFGGVSTYLGDFNESDLLYRPSPLGGLFYRYNLNNYLSIRAQAAYSSTKGTSRDSYGDLPGFPAGNAMAFERSMVMVDGGFEFNFLPFNPIDNKRTNRRMYIFSPYLTLGAGANFMGTNRYNNNPQLDIAAGTYPELYGKPGKTFPQSVIFEVPVGFGIKVSPVNRLTVSGEWTFKKMFYDDVDGFTNKGGGSIGLINDDWITTITVGVSFRFASSRRCDAYQTKYNPKESSTGLQQKVKKQSGVSMMQDKTSKNATLKSRKLEGKLEVDNNKAKKKKKK